MQQSTKSNEICSSQECGSDIQSMINILCSLTIRLDYLCIRSASTSLLKMLDLIQARALRCITVAPISAMQVETGESEIRRQNVVLLSKCKKFCCLLDQFTRA